MDWRIAEKPEFEFVVQPFKGEKDADVWIKGKIDRIDYKDGVGYRLIDYKTWDDATKAMGHVLSGGKAEEAFAKTLKLPTLPPARANAASKRFLSVQLPLYRRCLEMVDPGKFDGKVADCCYLVLGKNLENTGIFGSKFEEKMSNSEAKNEKREKFGIGTVALPEDDIYKNALNTARTAIRAIRANLFWPPGPGKALDYGLKDIFLNSPANDLMGSDWLAKQEKRLKAFTGEEEGKGE